MGNIAQPLRETSQRPSREFRRKQAQKQPMLYALSKGLNIEPEMNYIAFLHDVVFSFES